MSEKYENYVKKSKREILLNNYTVYDYFFQHLHPDNVSYGEPFYIHQGGEITTKRKPGSIIIDPVRGYKNFNGDGVSVNNKWVYLAYMDYSNFINGTNYDLRNNNDIDAVIEILSNELGITVEGSTQSYSRPKQTWEPRRFKNLLEETQERAEAARNKANPIEFPKPAKYGELGKAPDYTLIKYFGSRGINPNTVRALSKQNLLYLSESNSPYYKLQRDEKTNEILKGSDGKYLYETDENGNKIPQTYFNEKENKEMPKMKYNIVFASKDRSKEFGFAERKPIAKRGQAFIVSNSSSVGRFSFTGGLPDFAQVDAPNKTKKPMKAYICEAAVDAISLYELHKMIGMTEPAEYISISGSGKSTAVEQAIMDKYDCILAFDNDESGKKGMDARRSTKFIDPQSGQEVSLPCIVPPKFSFEYEKGRYGKVRVEAKDWNDVLLGVTKGTNLKTLNSKGIEVNITPDDVKAAKIFRNAEVRTFSNISTPNVEISPEIPPRVFNKREISEEINKNVPKDVPSQSEPLAVESTESIRNSDEKTENVSSIQDNQNTLLYAYRHSSSDFTPWSPNSKSEEKEEKGLEMRGKRGEPR